MALATIFLESQEHVLDLFEIIYSTTPGSVIRNRNNETEHVCWTSFHFKKQYVPVFTEADSFGSDQFAVHACGSREASI